LLALLYVFRPSRPVALEQEWGIGSLPKAKGPEATKV
jgi:hypothetical protein